MRRLCLLLIVLVQLLMIGCANGQSKLVETETYNVHKTHIGKVINGELQTPNIVDSLSTVTIEQKDSVLTIYAVVTHELTINKTLRHDDATIQYLCTDELGGECYLSYTQYIDKVGEHQIFLIVYSNVWVVYEAMKKQK